MEHRVFIKLLICYVAAAVSMFLLLNLFGVWRLERSLIERKKEALYAEASMISSEYADRYFRSQLTIQDMKRQLTTVDTFLDVRIWVTNSSGRLLLDTRGKNTGLQSQPELAQLDSDLLAQRYIEEYRLEELIDQPVLIVIEPMAIDYSVRGYICLLADMEGIRAETVYYMDFVNVAYLVFLGLLLLLFAAIYMITVFPLHRIRKAVAEYAQGHYEYPLRLRTQDEYRQLAEAVCFMSKELQSLEDYRKNFISNVSHDFRSPLTSIKGYVEAMLDGTIPAQAQARYLDIILFETERLTKLTSDLLTLGGIDSSGMTLERTVFDLNAVISKTAATFEGICTKKRIMMNLEFSDWETMVYADRGKIQQVLHNLLDNAVKFSNSDSSIRVTTEEKGNKVFVSIKDNGIGIPKDAIKKVWARFYKSDLSRGKDKKGTGLGLSIVKEILKAHDENINVVSTEGVGTEFIFSLPRAE